MEIIKISLCRQTILNIPPYNIGHFVESKDQGYCVFIEEMRNFIANDGYFIKNQDWGNIAANLFNLLSKKRKGEIEKIIPTYLDNQYMEKSDKGVLISAGYFSWGFNMFYCTEGKRNRQEQRWIEHEFVDSEKISELKEKYEINLKKEYEKKTKEELIEELVKELIIKRV